MTTELDSIKQDYVTQWGALGSQWGINRTMAMIHAHLLVSPTPLTTDEIMGELEISRGNANTNLRELASWGLIRSVVMRGDRKDYYEAEKDVWKIFCIVARERKKREIEPAEKVLNTCIERSKNIRSAEGKELHKQLIELNEFVSVASAFMDKIASKEHNTIIPKVMKILS